MTRIVSWFSCGAASAVATKLALQSDWRSKADEFVIAYVFVRFARIAAEKARDGQPAIAFDVAKAFDEVQDKRSPKIVIGGVAQPPQTPPPVRAEFIEVFEGIAPKDQNTALEVLRAGVA